MPLELGNAIGPPLGAALLAPGLRWSFAGDSHTFGSGASNASYSFSRQAISDAGGLVARRDSINAGVAGETSAQLLARMDAAIANAEGTVVLIGTNDAGNAINLDMTAANLVAIIRKAKTKGPVVLCTIPPRATVATTAIKNATAGINAWIRLAAPAFGCALADVNAAVVDPATGGLLGANDSGDGIHLSNLGHQVAGAEVAKAMKRAQGRTEPYALIHAAGSAGLISTDPLGARATATGASGWYEWAGGSGTAPTYSMVSDSSGKLPSGRWAQMDFDATASGGTRRLTQDTSTGFAAGDLVLLTYTAQIEDVTGTWRADVAAGTCAFDVSIINQAASTILASTLPRAGGIASATAGVYDLGPQVSLLTVPAGTTKITPWFSVTVATGKRVKVRIGHVALINLTTLGLANYFAGWGSAMVAV